jgi:N-terminal acetyltransferase B complex non-catalytic subunit
MLADCKVYWEHHSTLVTCFSDLQIFVRELSPENAADFYKFIRTQTMDTLSNPGSKEVCFFSFPQSTRFRYEQLTVVQGTNVAWETIEQNITKFEYLLAISRPSEPAVQAFEDMVAKSIKYCKNFPDNSAEGSVAVYSLLNLHHRFICQDEPRNPFGITINSRVLLQATMLARHLVECDKEKQNRALALLAARLHLNLGLGKCAFRLYSHAKCKEMLVDTLAPYVLSRISLTHPFEVKGYQGFSADEELAKAIVTMDRMEKKMENIVYSDMDSFPWDQAENLLDTKRKLNSSLTKHLCVTERRRMARLKGQTIDHLQVLDFKSKRHFLVYL